MKSLLLRLSIILLIAFLTANCDGSSKVSTANYDKIEEGMSLTKVKEILGEPTKLGGSASSLGIEAIWEGQQASIVVRFVDEKVDSKEFKKK